MHLNIYSLGGQWRGSKILYRNDFYKMKAISINEKNHCIKVQPASLLIFLIILIILTKRPKMNSRYVTVCEINVPNAVES